MCLCLYQHQWNTEWAFTRKLHTCIFTHENNMLSSHMKRSPSLWLHNKSHLFHWCWYNRENIACPLVDVNFIFSCSTQSLSSERSKWARYRVEHSKIKFIPPHGHEISSISFTGKWKLLFTYVHAFVTAKLDSCNSLLHVLACSFKF